MVEIIYALYLMIGGNWTELEIKKRHLRNKKNYKKLISILQNNKKLLHCLLRNYVIWNSAINYYIHIFLQVSVNIECIKFTQYKNNLLKLYYFTFQTNENSRKEIEKMHRSNSDSRRDRQQRFSFKNRMKPSSLQDVVIYIFHS